MVLKVLQMFWLCLINIESKTKEKFCSLCSFLLQCCWSSSAPYLRSYFNLFFRGSRWTSLIELFYMRVLGPLHFSVPGSIPMADWFSLFIFLGPTPSAFSTLLTPPFVVLLQQIWLQCEMLLPKSSFLAPPKGINIQVFFPSRVLLLITRGK